MNDNWRCIRARKGPRHLAAKSAGVGRNWRDFFPQQPTPSSMISICMKLTLSRLLGSFSLASCIKRLTALVHVSIPQHPAAPRNFNNTHRVSQLPSIYHYRVINIATSAASARNERAYIRWKWGLGVAFARSTFLELNRNSATCRSYFEWGRSLEEASIILHSSTFHVAGQASFWLEWSLAIGRTESKNMGWNYENIGSLISSHEFMD